MIHSSIQHATSQGHPQGLAIAACIAVCIAGELLQCIGASQAPHEVITSWQAATTRSGQNCYAAHTNSTRHRERHKAIALGTQPKTDTCQHLQYTA
jgi:hypothetical protein